MVKHIVVWKLKDEALGRSRTENALLIQDRLGALVGRIPGLVRLEVGVNANPKETSADVVLVTELESWAALEVYQNHPEHLEVASLVGAVREDRRCVDWEV